MSQIIYDDIHTQIEEKYEQEYALSLPRCKINGAEHFFTPRVLVPNSSHEDDINELLSASNYEVLAHEAQYAAKSINTDSWEELLSISSDFGVTVEQYSKLLHMLSELYGQQVLNWLPGTKIRTPKLNIENKFGHVILTGLLDVYDIYCDTHTAQILGEYGGISLMDACPDVEKEFKLWELCCSPGCIESLDVTVDDVIRLGLEPAQFTFREVSDQCECYWSSFPIGYRFSANLVNSVMTLDHGGGRFK